MVYQKILCSDNGTNFASSDFKDFSKSWKFIHVTSSPHHPRGNGKAESAVKIAKKLIKTSKNGDLWFNLLHQRNIPNKIDSTPTQRMFARFTETTLPTAINNLQPKIIKNVPKTIEVNKQNSKFYFDRKTKKMPELQIGQSVHVQIQPEQSNKWSPGIIEQKMTDRSYMVNCDKRFYRRNIVNIRPSIHPNGNEEKGNSQQITEQHIPESQPIQQPLRTEPRTTLQKNAEESTTTPQKKTKEARKERQEDNSERSNSTKSEENARMMNRPKKQDKPGEDAIMNRPKRQSRLPAKYNDFVCN